MLGRIEMHIGHRGVLLWQCRQLEVMGGKKEVMAMLTWLARERGRFAQAMLNPSNVLVPLPISSMITRLRSVAL